MATVAEKMTAIADAIRAKTGGTDPLTLDGMAAAIAGIETGGGGAVETCTVNVNIWNEGTAPGRLYYTDASGRAIVSREITTMGDLNTFNETLTVSKGLFVLTRDFMNSQFVNYFRVSGEISIVSYQPDIILDIQGDGSITY